MMLMWWDCVKNVKNMLNKYDYYVMIKWALCDKKMKNKWITIIYH